MSRRPGGPGPGHGPGGPGAMRSGKPKNAGAAVGRLLSYMRPDMWRVTAAMLCVVISSATMLAGSYLLKPIIDDLTRSAGGREVYIDPICYIAFNV